MKGAFEQLKGKTIRSIIISEYNAGSPRHQFFMVFDDDTSFEVFGEEFRGANKLDDRGEETVLEYAKKFCGTIRII